MDKLLTEYLYEQYVTVEADILKELRMCCSGTTKHTF